MNYLLPEICNIQYGFAFDSKQFSDENKNGSIPLIRIRDVKRGFSETYYDGDYDQSYLVHKNDLLIGMDGEFNIARWKSGDALLNQRVCKIQANSDVDEEYLRFMLIGKLKEIERKTAFVTVKHLSAKELNRMKVEMPSYLEQHRRAEILSGIEQIKSKYEKSLKDLDCLVKSRFVEMFNGEEYLIKKLGSVCHKITDGTHKTPTYLESGVKFISAKNIVDGRLDLSDVKYISGKEYEEIQNRCQTSYLDILLSKSGSLGSPAIIRTNEKLGLFESLAVLKYDREILLPEFLCEQLKTDKVQKQFTSGTKGVAVKHLHLGVISDIDIIVPPIEEQAKFSIFVNQIDKSKSVIQKSLDETQLLFDSLMQEYFG